MQNLSKVHTAPQGVSCMHIFHKFLPFLLGDCRKLMQQTAFDPTYIGVTPSGATWIAENTNIRLLGEEL